MNRLCQVCPQQGTYRCKQCSEVYYCSAACQKKDWKIHRPECDWHQASLSTPKEKELFEHARQIGSRLSKLPTYLREEKHESSSSAWLWLVFASISWWHEDRSFLLFHCEASEGVPTRTQLVTLVTHIVLRSLDTDKPTRDKKFKEGLQMRWSDVDSKEAKVKSKAKAKGEITLLVKRIPKKDAQLYFENKKRSKTQFDNSDLLPWVITASRKSSSSDHQCIIYRCSVNIDMAAIRRCRGKKGLIGILQLLK